jgi:hypothetical protein
MVYDPTKDPEVVASRKKWEAEHREFKRKLDETLAGLRSGIMTQNTQNGATGDAADVNDPVTDTAIKGIEAPFQLSADDIFQRAEKETGQIVYDVIRDGRVLFSTITAPLAHAFVAGYNAKRAPGSEREAQHTAKGNKTDGGAVDPKEQDKTGKGGSSDKAAMDDEDRDKGKTTTASKEPPARKRMML